MMLLQCLVICLSASAIVGQYQYEIKYFEGMPVDHFSFANNATFSLRYLINDTFWDAKTKAGAGPIFFYCGNEGDIETFAQNTGFMWDLAPEFRALVVFAEHRYYGKTLPFGNASYVTPENLGYLSSEQALADYAVFLRWLKTTRPGADKSPVIAFGGSYGGMLAAWMRMKYPNIITGALASSAPILQFTGITPCWAFNEVATRTFANSGKNCDKTIKRSWDYISELANSSSGLDWLNREFRLCPESLLTNSSTVNTFMGWLNSVWTYMAMVDYPYPANFLNPTPAWPVKEACKFLTNPDADPEELLIGVFNAVAVFSNYTGQTACYHTSEDASAGLGIDGWDFQACTEMVMPMCSNGSDMFPVSPWNLSSYSDDCFHRLGVRPRPFWAETNYWGTDLSAASNIIFSNGGLDPWSSGGVNHFASVYRPPCSDNDVILLYIEDGAHHLDLRGANVNDTKAVKEARAKEKATFIRWIEKPPAAGAFSAVIGHHHYYLFVMIIPIYLVLYSSRHIA